MRAFVRVARLRSFSGAARELGVSQATVSKHVQMLEDWLGVHLFHRTTRRVALSEAGEIFLVKFNRVLEDIEAARESVGPAAPIRGNLRITAPVAFGSTCLGPLIVDFLQQHPDLSVNIELLDRTVDVIEEGFDLAISADPIDSASLVSHRLTGLNYIACASPHYLANHPVPTQPLDLADHDCIIGSGSATETWRFAGPKGDLDVEIRGRLQVNSALLRRDAARAGAGILFSADYLVRDDITAGRLVRVLPDFTTNAGTMSAICSPHSAAMPKVRSLVTFLVQQLGKTPQLTSNDPLTSE